MKKVALPIVAALGLIVAAAPAHAQFGGMLRGMMGGSNSPSANAGASPDAYLQEARETTQIVMVSVAVLAEASREKMEMNTLSARIDEINGCQNVGQLNAVQDSFNSDMQAIKTNEQSAEVLRTAYVHGDARRKELLGSASFNLMWAGLRTALLVSQSGDLISTLRQDPVSAMMKAPQLIDAARLLGRQAQSVPTIYSYARIIMREAGAEEPREAQASGARSIVLA